MKITRRQLRRFIMNEVSSYQMSKYDQASSNVKMIAELIMSGMETLSGQDLSQENKYEYGEDVISMLNKYMEPQGIKSLASIFMEMRSGDRSRFDQEAPAKPIEYLGGTDDYPKHIGYTDPDPKSETYGENVMIMVQTRDDMDDILDPLLRLYPDLQVSVD